MRPDTHIFITTKLPSKDGAECAFSRTVTLNVWVLAITRLDLKSFSCRSTHTCRASESVFPLWDGAEFRTASNS